MTRRANAALAAIIGGLVLCVLVLGIAVAQAWAADPPTWPQVTRCEVVQPEDLDSTR